MKVLIIHQHFRTPNEGGAIRSYYLAKSLLARGIAVSVITAGNNRGNTVIDYEGIDVHYLAIPYDNTFGFWKRSKSFLNFVFGAVRTAKSIPEVNLCYVMSVPLTTGLIGKQIKWLSAIPYIFEVGDLWPDAPIQLGFVRNFLFKRILYQLEKYVYLGAKSIVALSPAIQDSIRKKLTRADKPIYLIPNMADTLYYQPSSKDAALKVKFGIADEFVVSYIGAVGVANGLDYFIECARASMQAGLAVRFLICGEGALLNQHIENVKRLQLNNLVFVSFRSRDGVKEVMNVTDAVFVCYKPYKILETGSPNKYFDGLAAGKMVIINFGGWIKEEIEKEQCGIALDSQSPIDFVGKISPFVRDLELLSSYQRSARSLAEKKYSRSRLSDQYADMIIEEFQRKTANGG